MTQILEFTRHIPIVAGLFAALTLGACSPDHGSGQNQSNLGSGMDDPTEVPDAPPEDPTAPHPEDLCPDGFDDPCFPIAAQLEQETDPSVLDALIEALDACIGDHWPPEPPTGEGCEMILEALEWETDPEIFELLMEEYRICTEGEVPPDEPPGAHCEAILELTQFETDPAIIDELLRAFDECMAGEVPPEPPEPGNPCFGILAPLEWETDPQIVDFILEDFAACMETVGGPGGPGGPDEPPPPPGEDPCLGILEQAEQEPDPALRDELYLAFEACVNAGGLPGD